MGPCMCLVGCVREYDCCASEPHHKHLTLSPHLFAFVNPHENSTRPPKTRPSSTSWKSSAPTCRTSSRSRKWRWPRPRKWSASAAVNTSRTKKPSKRRKRRLPAGARADSGLRLLFSKGIALFLRISVCTEHIMDMPSLQNAYYIKIF